MPAIVVDAATWMVVDGHHRLSALKALGRTKVPCLLINYDHPALVLNSRDGMTKQQLTKQAVGRKALLPPKSTRHLVVDQSGAKAPIEVLSPMVWIAGFETTEKCNEDGGQ